MTENTAENTPEETCQEEEFSEPISLADHQILVYSARKLVKKARNFSAKKKFLGKVDKAKPVQCDKKTQNVQKVVIVPRRIEASSPRIIKMPPRVMPRQTMRSIVPLIPAPPANNATDPIASTSKTSPTYTPTAKTASLTMTIGDKKICIRPSASIIIPPKPKEANIEEMDTAKKKVFDPKVIERRKFVRPTFSKPAHPESFPKAIVYPEVPKEKPPMKITSVVSNAPISFNHVFEEAAAKQFVNNAEKSSKKRDRKQSFHCIKEVPEKNKKKKPKTPAPPEDELEQFIAVIDNPETLTVPIEKKAQKTVNYLIPQNLLASSSDKVIPTSTSEPIQIDDDDNADESQFEAVDTTEKEPSIPDSDFEFPPRPEINAQLIETLARYRVIARYLMAKKKVTPFSFVSTDSEYVNVYRTLKK